MNEVLFFSLVATFIISLLSLAGILTFVFNKKVLSKISLFLVAFSIGALLGGAFFHLLPEAIEELEEVKGLLGELSPFIFLILGIILFFILEKFLKWHHCHKEGVCKVHTFTYMSLFGDSLHNFLDGVIIVSAFSISTELGVATTFAVAAHELPQEFGDFGILIHGGFSRTKALVWNFISAVTAILGAIVGYYALESFESISPYFLSFATGGFIYIAMSDLLPELHKETKPLKSLFSFAVFLAGILFMFFIKMYFEG